MIYYEILARIYQEEILAEAERLRLMKKDHNHLHRLMILYANSLIWLGNMICHWGNLLERRFGAESSINQSKSIENSLLNDL